MKIDQAKSKISTNTDTPKSNVKTTEEVTDNYATTAKV